jgi:hypothetical protein
MLQAGNREDSIAERQVLALPVERSGPLRAHKHPRIRVRVSTRNSHMHQALKQALMERKAAALDLGASPEKKDLPSF